MSVNMTTDNQMIIDINDTNFGGSVRAIASKSHAHRLLIAAALSESKELYIECRETSADIDATVSCLNAMGAEITRTDSGFKIRPIPRNMFNSDKYAAGSNTCTELNDGVIHTDEHAVTSNTCTELNDGVIHTDEHVVTNNTCTELDDGVIHTDGYAEGSNTSAAAGDLDNGVIRLDAGESGSTLRFLLPVIGVLGLTAGITTHGRLSARPLSPLYEEMQAKGVRLSPQGSNPLTLSGKMSGGTYTIAGNISSQYITGLLLALPLAKTDSEIRITGELASRPYVDITLSVLHQAGIIIEEHTADPNMVTSDNDSVQPHAPAADDVTSVFKIKGGQHYNLPGHCTVEGDWSNAAFFLAAGAIAKSPVTVTGLNINSKQGDKAVLSILREFGADVNAVSSAQNNITTDHTLSSDHDSSADHRASGQNSITTDHILSSDHDSSVDHRASGSDNNISLSARSNMTKLSDITITPQPLHGIEIDAENIPDLVPVLSLVASVADGTTIIRHIERLRIKESDRVATVIDTLSRLGADIYEEDRCLVINGRPSLTGGTVDSCNDHRIAMTAAIAAICCTGQVTITDPMAVRKSYPGFYDDYSSLTTN